MGSLLSIEIKNFKAFRDFAPLRLDGRHLLLYGANGSGKSSLYWALHAFLESAQKSQADLQKYFDPDHKESLVNIHAAPLDISAASLKLTVKDAGGGEKPYEISHTEHQTANKPDIAKARLASDFITYRFVLGFSNFRNSEPLDIWKLFEREILPFCVPQQGGVFWPKDIWDQIKDGDPNPHKYTGGKAVKTYAAFTSKAAEFSSLLEEILNQISTKAQDFYDAHFSSDDIGKITFKLSLTTKPAYNQVKRQLTLPAVELEIQRGEAAIFRPQVFLNEAKLTQLALSIRFAASLVKLQDSELKLLVLDDLLISLDMSNRMKVVEILLSETFANYQKIILTHDLGFFQEACRRVGSDHHKWLFNKIDGNAMDGPCLHCVKSDLELARDYIESDQLTECGNRLRKYVEANLETFLRAANAKKGLDRLYDYKKFTSLQNRISEAKHLLALSGHKEFAELLESQFSVEELKALLAPDGIDPAAINAATKKEKGKIVARLMAAKADLHQIIIELLTDASRKRLNAIKILRDVENIKDRILNPASHAGVAPIYTKEAQDAVKVIQELDAALTAALATL